MNKNEAGVKLADAVLRWFVAGQAVAVMSRKVNASALSAIVSGGKQNRHEERSKFFQEEYQEAEKSLRLLLSEYARISPESVPQYPYIELSESEKLHIKSMDWLAAVTSGAFKL